MAPSVDNPDEDVYVKSTKLSVKLEAGRPSVEPIDRGSRKVEKPDLDCRIRIGSQRGAIFR